MKLSIIIPVYNEEEYISFALESAIYQRVNFDYEIIVYDDNSSDNTASIVKTYQKQYPKIRYYKNSKNLGNAKTFYNAINIAKGDYFQVLDGDDFFTNWHKLEKQVQFLDNNQDHCAVCHDSISLYNSFSNFYDEYDSASQLIRTFFDNIKIINKNLSFKDVGLIKIDYFLKKNCKPSKNIKESIEELIEFVFNKEEKPKLKSLLEENNLKHLLEPIKHKIIQKSRNNDGFPLIWKENYFFSLDRLELGEGKTYGWSYNKKLFHFYHHTSTFMFKNIFKHNKYKILSKEFCRGDVVRFQLIQSATNEKIAFLNFVGSIYNINGTGIWTKLNQKEKHELNCSFLKDRIKYLFSGIEKEALKNQLTFLKQKKEEGHKIQNSSLNINEILRVLKKTLSYALENEILRKHLFQNCNYFPQIDNITESIGRICLFQNGYKLLNRSFKDGVYAFIICGLSDDSGGGIIKEIKDFIEVFSKNGNNIYVFSTELVKTSDLVIKKYFTGKNINFIGAQGENDYEKLNFLMSHIYELAPERMYPYISHCDIIASCLLQKHLAKEIILSWVYDHGTSVGISNSSITSYIAKNSSYYYTLKNLNKNNIVDIIPPSFKFDSKNSYIPFNNHDNLITASACARSYKIESPYIFKYMDIIPEMLKRTQGAHYHFGDISEDYKQKIYLKMDELGVCRDRFIHIRWDHQFIKSLFEKKIDLFIAPFPVTSIRILLEVNCSGIPILAHHSTNRLFSSKFFLSCDNFFWENKEDFFSAIRQMNKNTLQTSSNKIKKYCRENHSEEKVKNLLIDKKSLEFQKNMVFEKSFIPLVLEKKSKDIGIMNVENKEIYINYRKNTSESKKIFYSLMILLYNVYLTKFFISGKKYKKFLEKLSNL